MPVQIFVVEDNELMREMLIEFLNDVSDFEVCGTAATAEVAMTRLGGIHADLVLIDMALPEMSGADLVEKLVKRNPDLRCLMYSGHRERSYVERALANGARGYVLKGAPDELPKAIRAVLDGEIFVSGTFKRRQSSPREA